MTEIDPQKKKKQKVVLNFCLILLAFIVLGYFFWANVLRTFEWTDDAYVEGNKVVITPLINGFVTAIHTDDSFLVKKGQLIVELDKTDAKLALEISKNEYAKNVRDVCQYFHDVFALKAQIAVDRANLIKTIQDYQHRANVIEQEGVSLEDFEHSIAFLKEAYYVLKKDIANYEKALSYVQGTTIVDHPLVKASSDRLIFNFVQLYRCNIYSPVDGLAAQRQIQVGMWVASGYSMMSVIPLDQIWVNANYKETQMRRMRIGQKVKITADLYGDDVVFDGRIVGLPGAAGNAYSLLPPQNLSGNWIKIVQRLPVRVALDEQQLIEHPLRLGLSLESTVDLTDQSGLLVPKTTKGSPNYETNIFKKEEDGAKEVVETIFNQNMDPTLARYIYEPLYLQKEVITEDIQEFISCLGP
jgi:membrane fusion protein (multidrug efflux system)